LYANWIFSCCFRMSISIITKLKAGEVSTRVVCRQKISKENPRLINATRERFSLLIKQSGYMLCCHKSKGNLLEENFIGGFYNRRRPLNALRTRKASYLIINLCPMIYYRLWSSRMIHKCSRVFTMYLEEAF
jgi:hypothetical protein